MDENSVGRKILHAAVCLFLAIAVLAFVGAFLAFLIGRNVPCRYAVGLLLGIVAAILILLGLYRPLSLYASRVLKGPFEEERNRTVLKVCSVSLGVSLMIGVVIFVLTGASGVLLLFFMLPFVLMEVGGVVMKRYAKTKNPPHA